MPARHQLMLPASAVLLSLLMTLVGMQHAAAQANAQTLTVSVAVCPEDYAGDDLAEVCGSRLAFAYDVSVSVLEPFESISSDVLPGDGGRAVVDISGYTPATLHVVVRIDLWAGSQGLSCTSNGFVVPAEHDSESRATFPVLQVEANTTDDIDCVVYLYGSIHDDLLDIRTVDSADVPEEITLGGRDDDEEITTLPNTGTGPYPRTQAGTLFLILAWLVLGAGLYGLRIRRV